MIPGEIRSKIPLEMTAAHYSSYLNEVSPHLRRAHLVKTHYLLVSGALMCDAVTSLRLSDSPLSFSLSGGSEPILLLLSGSLPPHSSSLLSRVLTVSLQVA